MSGRFATLLVLAGLASCQSMRDEYRPKHLRDPAECRRLEAEYRGDLHTHVALNPDGSCQVASVPN